MDEQFLNDDFFIERIIDSGIKYPTSALHPIKRKPEGKYAVFSKCGVLKFVQFEYPIFQFDKNGICWSSQNEFKPYLSAREVFDQPNKRIIKILPSFYPLPSTDSNEIKEWDTWTTNLHCRFYGSNNQTRDFESKLWFQAKVENPGQDSKNWRIIPFEFLVGGFFDAIGLNTYRTDLDISEDIEVVSDCFLAVDQIEAFLYDFLCKVFKKRAEQFEFLIFLNNSFNTTDRVDTNKYKHQKFLGVNTLNWKEAIRNTFSSIEFEVFDDKRVYKNTTTIYEDPNVNEITGLLKKLNLDINTLPKFSDKKYPHMELLRHLYKMNREGAISVTYKQAATICFAVFHPGLVFNTLTKRAHEVFHGRPSKNK